VLYEVSDGFSHTSGDQVGRVTQEDGAVGCRATGRVTHVFFDVLISYWLQLTCYLKYRDHEIQTEARAVSQIWILAMVTVMQWALCS